MNSTQRRKYKVKSLNTAQYINTNFKLIEYRLNISGIIDSFSRIVVSLLVVNNNKVYVVLTNFKKANNIYGILLIVYSDYSIENIFLVKHIISLYSNIFEALYWQNISL